MRLVERRARSKRSRQFNENSREKAIMQMNHGLAPILARPHQPDGNAVRVGVGIVLRVPAETADIRFIGKIDRDLAIGCSDMTRLLMPIDRLGLVSYGLRRGGLLGSSRRRQRAPAVMRYSSADHSIMH